MISFDRARLELRRSLRPLVIFLAFCAAGGVAFAVVFRNLTFERPWQDYRTVQVAVDDAKGIFPGKHQVRISGVKVGVVSAAELENGTAVMTLRIEKKQGPIYRDARLQIRPVTPLQDLYVNVLDRGSERAGEADESYVIPAQNTVEPVDISRILDTFDADTRERLTILLHELGRGLDDGGEQLRASFAEIVPFLDVARRATSVLAERERNVRGLIHNFGALTAALAKRDDELTTLVRSGNASLAELATNDAPLGATISRIPPTLAAMRGSFASVRELSAELDPTLRDLEPVTTRLESGLRGLERFGHDALPALRALRPAVRDLRPMARTLVPTSRSLETALARFRDQAPSFDALTQEPIPCLRVMQDFFHHTLSVFKWEDSVGAFPRAEMTVDLDGYGSGQAGDVNTRPVSTCVKKDGGSQ